jgi:hypothetical protein
VIARLFAGSFPAELVALRVEGVVVCLFSLVLLEPDWMLSASAVAAGAVHMLPQGATALTSNLPQGLLCVLYLYRQCAACVVTGAWRGLVSVSDLAQRFQGAVGGGCMQADAEVCCMSDQCTVS